MKNLKKISCLLLTLFLALTFTACENPFKTGAEQNKNTEAVALTTDEAEAFVEEFMDILKEGDFDSIDSDDYLTENCMEASEDTLNDLKEKFEDAFSISANDSGDKNAYKSITAFDYDIKSLKEKDGKVVVKVEVSNRDFSFLSELMDMAGSDEKVIAYLQTAIDSGKISENEVVTFLNQTEEPSPEKYVDFFYKASGKKIISETIECTVIKDGENIKIDELDDFKTLMQVLMLNVLGTL